MAQPLLDPGPILPPPHILSILFQFDCRRQTQQSPYLFPADSPLPRVSIPPATSSLITLYLDLDLTTPTPATIQKTTTFQSPPRHSVL